MNVRRTLFILLLCISGVYTLACNRGDSRASNAVPADELPAVASLEKHASEFTTTNAQPRAPMGKPPTPNPSTRTIKLGISFEDVWPCDVGIQASPWDDELTLEEKMLANGYEEYAGNGDSYEPFPGLYDPVGKVSSLMLFFYRETGREPESRDELLQWAIELNRKYAAEMGDSEEEMLAQMYSDLQSPVTGKLLEWDHQNFSRGNAFIRIVNSDPEAKQSWAKSLINTFRGKEDEAHPEVDPNRDPVSVYVRVYGESGIILDRVHHMTW